MNLPHLELMYILQYGYIALFLILIGSELVAFAPVGILLIALGALTKTGVFDFWFLLIVSTLGSVAGDYVVFHIAGRVGKKEGYRRFVNGNRFIELIERHMTKHPRATISLSRLIGFAGVPVNAIAGLSGISQGTFFVFDTLGNLLCCFVYLAIGYYLGAAWQYDSRIATFILGVIFTISLLGYLSFYFLSRKKGSRSQ